MSFLLDIPNWTDDFVIAVYVHVLLFVHEIYYDNQPNQILYYDTYTLLCVDTADIDMCLFVISAIALTTQ